MRLRIEVRQVLTSPGLIVLTLLAVAFTALALWVAPSTYGTSDHALRDRGQLSPGETLLVLGAAGGVGLAAIEIGKALGAQVIACASTADKPAGYRGPRRACDVFMVGAAA